MSYRDIIMACLINIRNNFTLTTETEETLSQDIKFDQFRPVSIAEISKVITSYNSKSCELDPIPKWLLKLCIDELLPPLHPLLTSLSNMVFFQLNLNKLLSDRY